VEENRLGVIDSLSAGLNLISQRAWVIAIPVLLDLWYWLGPRLSIAPLLNQVGQALARSALADTPDLTIRMDVVAYMLELFGQQLNLFSLLSVSLLGVPSLIGSSSHNVRTIELDSWLALLGLSTLLLLVGLGIGCLYLTLIAQGLQRQPAGYRTVLRDAGMTWLRVIGLGLMLLFFSVALAVPFSVMIRLVAFLNLQVALFVVGFFQATLFWTGLYTFYVVNAIIINRVGPIMAIWNSLNVVARNFWSAFGLIVLIFILSLGLSLIWQRLGAVHPAGMFVGIVGHAFIGSSLVAAGLLFYRDRYQRWKQPNN
jgi:hypothetical protein